MVDLLAEVLAVGGVRGALGALIEAGSGWGWWAARSPRAAFHAVTSGTAWLRVPGGDPVQLMPGDVLLLPRGDAHVLASDLDAVARTGPHRFDGYEEAAPGVVTMGTGPVQTRILCAHYEHDPAISLQVLAMLPDLVHIRAASSDDRLEDTVRLLGRELTAPQVASTVVLDSLVDILLVQLLRAHLRSSVDEGGPSWLRILTDPVVGAAVAKMHDEPARSWTTELLAREVAVSRSTLARRFPEVLGTTPSAYLTRWRMDLAARQLQDTDDTLDQIAHSVGYTSVYAFNRAFRRISSQPPGRYRAMARTRGSTDPADADSASHEEGGAPVPMG